ncbi:beta-propeller fold lactonase family protein [Sphingomonas sp. BK069]|uniref:YVTN family beta-propeller repeat protein n=1 Tax=Sphingomonas sp. BK069 TaxID=2586979 RepID=UPI00161FF484|nr:beta-propeller fold lactonase family protein [Sphingomonas sp. BK069]MBB3348374.1 YVTN family beta-propeller protein [Sphingomonas sp. BK069]
MKRLFLAASLIAGAANAQSAPWAAPAAIELPLVDDRPEPAASGGTGKTQVPWGHRAIAVSAHDRVYAAEQLSNTLSVTNPATNELLGVIRLGSPQAADPRSPHEAQALVSGLGFSPDGRTLAVVSIGSDSVTWIDTATNAIKHTSYIGRSPHGAFFTPDGKEVWVTVRGGDHIAVLDPRSFEETGTIRTPVGPGMTIFSPDGRYGYVCSSSIPELVVFDVATHEQVGRVQQPSSFCPDIAVSPDGRQVWFTLKDVGKTVAFDARPPFAVLRVIDTGPITNHVNFAATAKGQFAYVTVGGLNQVKVFRIRDYRQVATIAVGSLPHGLWPSGDGSRVYVGLEKDDKLAVIDTATNKVTAMVPIGQAPQAIVYVPDAVPDGGCTANLQPLGAARETAGLASEPDHAAVSAATSATSLAQTVAMAPLRSNGER